MKYQKSLLAIALSLVLTAAISSCQKYDDSALISQIADLTRRVVKLEDLCSNLNTTINTLQQMVLAVQDDDRVTGISKIMKDGEEIGYTISFSKSGPVHIYHGQDGQTPVVGVKKDSDGEWYWTVDGEWMLNANGDKLKASASAPQLSIRDGYWYISVDGGKTWSKMERATGDSFFQSVIETSTYLELTLADGTALRIPKFMKISISFDDDKDIGILRGGQKDINYHLDNVAGQSLVKAIAQNGWKVKVEPKDNTNGTIHVTAPETLTDDEIIVLAYDGESSMVMAALNFMEGTISISDESLFMPGAGGQTSIVVSSNIGAEINIPYSARSWISYAVEPATKAMEDYRVTFTVGKNVSEGDRYALVTITDANGAVSKSLAIHQAEYDQYADITNGGETANCYIINATGDYKFPIVKGNGEIGVLLSGDTAEISGAASACIVWQDASIIQQVGIRKNYVTFVTENALPHGNAVIAVKDINGKILWSWHIWSTDYVLGEGDVTVTNFSKTNTYQMMPLNLGARSKSTISTTWNSTDAAVFYQFGRKDPFPPTSATKTASKGNLALSIENPDTYYTWNSYTDWCDDIRMDWWDKRSTGTSNYNNSSPADAMVNVGPKTIYDPCPPGYRVAPDDAFTGFTKTGAAVTSKSAINGSLISGKYAYSFNTGYGDVIFNICGGLNASEGAYLAGIGYYQSSHAAGLGIQRQLLIDLTGAVNPMCAVYARALAGAVRAVKDTYVPREESTDYSSDGTTLTLQEHSVGKGIKVLIAGDGYMDRDIKAGLYDSDMKKAYEYLFTVEPFKSYKDRFDVVEYRAVSAISEFDSSKNTAFKVQLSNTTHITGDLSAAYRCANSVYDTVSDVLIIIVINSPKYAGTCYMSSNGTSVAFVPASQEYNSFEDVVHHEACGHGFGFLGDEYYYNETIPQSEIDDLNYWYGNYGWYPNVDVTSDRTAVKWAHFLSDPVYSSTVSIYEGAYTYRYGAYRPTYESIMNSNKGTFNSPSRYALFNRIMTLSGESTSWDKFVSYDKINLSSSTNAHKACSIPGSFVPLAPPVVVDAEFVLSSVRNHDASSMVAGESGERR